LEYGFITGAPVTVLTGEVGSGKTTLMHALLAEVPEDTKVGLISNANTSNGKLMRWINNSLDIPITDPSDNVEMFESFQNFVIGQFAEGHRVVIVIDEAQNLGTEILEELRMLTNINSGKNELLQLILIGQPELRALLSQHNLRQFAQRVAVSFHLREMDCETTSEYISHRLKRVGGSGEAFTEDAVKLIYEKSRGIPRVVNKLCELSLVYAASFGKDTVEVDTVQELLDDGLVLLTDPPFEQHEEIHGADPQGS